MIAPPPVRWSDLRRFTQARVALGRAGNGLPTGPHLAFQAAHAAARDAVHARLDVAALQAALGEAGIDSMTVASAVPDRRTYLMRPDLGRSLPREQAARLPAVPGTLLFVGADGLSVAEVLEPMQSDRFLSVLPRHHAVEFSCGFLNPMFGGSTIPHLESIKDIASMM